MENKVISWTDEQLSVINSRDKNLLVSASAGSGKTTVMIERIANLVDKQRVPISKFLVVTFTKASATDMKKKLIDKLLSLPVDDFILKQIEDVQTSDISNLHSFCARLVSVYFYKTQIDPAYHVIDDVEAGLIREKAIEKLFEEKEKNNDSVYFKLFEMFQTKRSDDGLKEAIYTLNGFLNSILDGKNWLLEKINQAHEVNLNKNICANIINNYVCGQIEEDAVFADEFANKALDLGCSEIYEYFVDISSMLRAVNKTKSYLVNAKQIFEMNFGDSPKVAKEFKELSKEATVVKNIIKDNLENYKNNYVSADETELIAGLNFGKETLKLLIDFVDEFNEIYSKMKKEVNGLDFNDLEKYALEILSDPAVCNDVRSKYSYVFVDEYQDINEVQEKIISLLSNSNNRFMVGDIKQSIYRFRFCDPEIFLATYDKYLTQKNTSEVINLNCNFRSDKKILKFVDMVFSGVMTNKFGGVDYEKDSQFVAGENNLDMPNSVNLCFIDTEKEKVKKELASGVYSVKNHEEELTESDKQAVAEGVYVARKIAELVNISNPNRIKYSDIAILVQSRNENVSKVLETLKSFGIPVSSDDKLDIVKKPYIDEILSFIKFCVNQKDDILLYKVLKSKLFSFSDSELVKVRKLDMKARFFDCIQLFENLTDNLLKEKIQRFIEKLNKFIELARVLNLKNFAMKIIDEFALKQINLAAEDGKNIVSEIEAFVSALPDIYPFEFVSNFENYSLIMQNECGDGSVKCMSIHASKGIEFKAVFLINVSKQFSMESLSGSFVISKHLGVGLKHFDFEKRTKNSSIPFSAVCLLERRKLVEEDQRVLYVALTRSIEKLFVVCSKNRSSLLPQFPNRPTSFINWFEPIISKELEGEHNMIINFESFKVDELILDKVKETPQLLLSKTKSNLQEEFVYKFAESVKVPLKNSVIKIINSKTEENYSELDFDDEYEKFVMSEDQNKNKFFAERGTAYHKVFEKINLQNLENIDEELLKIKLDILTEEEADFIDFNLVKNVLNLPFLKEIKNDDIVIKEREFCAYFPANILNESADSNDKFILQGVIDLCLIRNGELIILDYKTGKCSDEKLEKYKMQLNLYSDAISRAFKMPVSKAYICFIDLQKVIEI